LACSLGGGTHHAHFDNGGGFSTFNDLAVAAKAAIKEKRARKVLIIDVDVHQGDGTATIFKGDSSVFTASFHCSDNFPLKKAVSDLDVNFPKGAGDKEVLSAISDIVPNLLDTEKPELVLYNAGVDMHVDDNLGFMSMSTQGLYQRDIFVLKECISRKIPIGCVIGGGYNTNRSILSHLHSTIHRAATMIWQTNNMAQEEVKNKSFIVVEKEETQKKSTTKINQQPKAVFA